VRPLLLATCALALAACGSKSPAPLNSPKAPPALGRSTGSAQAAQELGFPGFATKNTTRVGGANPVADAAAVARAVYPETPPAAVTVVDVDDWRAAISAAQLMARPVQAPVLLTSGGKLPDVLAALKPTGAAKLGRAQAIVVGRAPAPSGLRARTVSGADDAALARAIDRVASAAAGKPSDDVIVAPADRPAFAMPAAAYAAKSGVPVLWANADALPAATVAAIKARKAPSIYVLGPASAISDRVLARLRGLGSVKRVAGSDPVANAIAFARFVDGRFGWNVVDPGHGLVFANAERPADAAAGAALSGSGTYGPLLLFTDGAVVPSALQSYLLDIQPGYDKDPVRGVYNHGWLLGDADAISIAAQARIDSLLEIQPVDRTQ
jgi:hypothetical protein